MHILFFLGFKIYIIYMLIIIIINSNVYVYKTSILLLDTTFGGTMFWVPRWKWVRVKWGPWSCYDGSNPRADLDEDHTWLREMEVDLKPLDIVRVTWKKTSNRASGRSVADTATPSPCPYHEKRERSRIGRSQRWKLGWAWVELSGYCIVFLLGPLFMYR